MASGNPAAEAATPKACPSCGKRYPADALFCSFDGSPLTTTPGAIAAAAATDVYVGREISGHIEIRQLVGIGAMGRVYRAFQKGIDRDVAVKILHRELSANQTLVSRFHREAKVASRLAHPNVVHVLLAGQLPDGAMYIVMEYLDGMSLQSALGAAGGAMPLPRALHIALQLCDAAGEAHVQGVVHRDLKPENVMLVRRSDDPDYVKVLDFGIARLNWGEQSMATAAGLIFGTARYISPEGAQGEKVGPQGDVYSIATIVYQMLAGRSPFDAEQAVALLVQQIHDPPRPLKSIDRAAYVPEPIASVVMRNLSKRPEERAENARAFGRTLLEAAVEAGMSAQDILARPAMLPGTRGPHPSAVQMPSMLRTQTAYLTPEPSALEGRTQLRTEIPEPEALPPGIATTRWHPSPELEARMVPAPPPSGVDLTMDEQQVSSLPRTVVGTTPPAPASSPSSSQRTAPPSSMPVTAPPSTRTSPQASRPGFAHDGTRVDETADIAASHGGRNGPAVLLVACFAVGVVVMGLVAMRTGAGGKATAAHPQPSAGSAPELAAVDPVMAPVPAATLSAVAIPPLALDRNAGAGVGGSATGAAAARATLDVSTAKPSVGQPVDLAGHVVGAGGAHKIDGTRFHISGPGLAGADVSAVDDGSGAYRASFTFLQAGRFEVDFLARVDGGAARSARMLVVGDGRTALPSAASTGAAPATAPATTGDKWM